jgi:hypothetical protein
MWFTGMENLLDNEELLPDVHDDYDDPMVTELNQLRQLCSIFEHRVKDLKEKNRYLWLMCGCLAVIAIIALAN